LCHQVADGNGKVHGMLYHITGKVPDGFFWTQIHNCARKSHAV
jgi:hypothetical protein